MNCCFLVVFDVCLDARLLRFPTAKKNGGKRVGSPKKDVWMFKCFLGGIGMF